MGIQRFLPETRKAPLLAAVLLFVAACTYSVLWFVWKMIFSTANLYTLAPVILLALLGYGVWRLNRVARAATVVFLFIAAFFTIFGSLGVVANSAAVSKEQVLTWITPVVILQYYCLWAFIKYKDEFKAKE